MPRIVDILKAPAKLADNAGRVDIVETIYDSAKGAFMALVRVHATGRLKSVKADDIITGSPGANLIE